MIFPSKDSKDEGIGEQLKVLATNIEVLNQKLLTDPNMAMSPGEALIKKELDALKNRFSNFEKLHADIMAGMDRFAATIESLNNSQRAYFEALAETTAKNMEKQEELARTLAGETQQAAQKITEAGVERLEQGAQLIASENQQFFQRSMVASEARVLEAMRLTGADVKKLLSFQKAIYDGLSEQGEKNMEKLSENSRILAEGTQQILQQSMVASEARVLEAMSSTGVEVKKLLSFQKAIYDGLSEQGEKNMEKQEELMKSITADNREFTDQIIRNAEDREKRVQDLHIKIYELHRNILKTILGKSTAP